ncbi:winged helix-turn-helix transcriptional regulator [Clostridium sp. BJN0001]|uniref:winged helix-turn-helix transcriptional regulator n=1 Tax=Clostridium sp. BJN0001 TaxID=2930219 RepID=UPI001FD0AC8A|nr:winged helix-turn-helix transcriptional regulator [Clostridium sp. BJN0001]
MIDDKIRILKELNENYNINQRELAQKTDISLGKVNSILKNFTEEKIIERISSSSKNVLYKVTDEGIKYLEKNISDAKNTRIKIHDEDKKKQVKTAVILGAGKTKDFDEPVGLLKIEDFTIIDRTINILKENGINKVILVVGYKGEKYEEYFAKSKNVHIVKNDMYKWTGTMQSLALAKEYVDDDFLLIENDLVFEKRAIKDLVESDDHDCILFTNESGSGDEAFVEIRNNCLFKMSKDIHQFNRIDGEMIGLTKISLKLYKMMLEEFKSNVNPYLNYEYVLLDAARDYKIGYVKIDDLVWKDADKLSEYKNIKNYVYPTIRRRELTYEIEGIKKIVAEAFSMSKDKVTDVERAGGMTNKNYKVTADNQKYILRIAGAGTEGMINRNTEMINSKIASEKGYNVDIPYFNLETGVKISKFIENAETLTHRSIKKEENLRKVCDILRSLHTSEDFNMKNEFNVFEELKKYENILREDNGEFFSDYDVVREKVIALEDEMEECGRVHVPSHNDLVSENFVKDTNGRIYLIDWEYSGTNDDMWDLAALSLENEFSDDDIELMFRLYFKGKDPDKNTRKRLIMNMIFQDMLWSVWTLIKEAEGDDFGTYGIDRYNRAKEYLNKLETEYK